VSLTLKEVPFNLTGTNLKHFELKTGGKEEYLKILVEPVY